MRYEVIHSLPGAGAAAVGPALERVIRGVLLIYIIALPFHRLLFLERNGIVLDPVGKRFIIVEFGGKSVLAWKPGDKAPAVIAKGPGGFDGVVIAGGKILVSSWSDSTVASYETGQEVKIITGVPSPADIGYDAKRNRVLIPVFTGNRVEVYQLP